MIIGKYQVVDSISFNLASFFFKFVRLLTSRWHFESSTKDGDGAVQSYSPVGTSKRHLIVQHLI